MRTGSSRWPVSGTFYVLLCTSLFWSGVLKAESLGADQVTWSDQVSKETSDGDIINTPPFVAIKNIRLRRFAEMQKVTLHDTLSIGKADEAETLMVFRVWQGGASQGEQLMLVSLSRAGLDVIGPHKSDFETMEIVPANNTQGPLFLLYGDEDGPHTALEYFAGQLVEQP